MGININKIYQRVLDTSNKEQRGYITPREFNVFAEQAQMEIFDSYFYDHEAYGRTRHNDSEHSDRFDIIREKIEYFEKEVYGASLKVPDTSGFNFFLYNMFTPEDFYKIQTILVSVNNNNQASGEVEATGFEGVGPVDYSQREKAHFVSEAEYVSKKELVYCMSNKLTRPTLRRPIYTFEGREKDFIRVFGADNYPHNYTFNSPQRYFVDPSYDTAAQGGSPRFRRFDNNGNLDPANVRPENIIITYIRKPITPRWGYITQSLSFDNKEVRKPLYDPARSVDFEVHSSEATMLTNKILQLAGVTLKQGDIAQVGTGKNNEKLNVRNK